MTPNYLTKVTPYIALTHILLFLIGCGTQKIFLYDEHLEGSLAKYKVIEIPNFKTNVPGVPFDASSRIPDMVAKKLKEKNLIFLDRACEKNQVRMLLLPLSIGIEFFSL